MGRPRGAYASLGANVVVELNSESHARQPTAQAWAIIRRTDRNQWLAGQRTSRPEHRHASRAPAAPTNPTKGDGCRRPLIPTSPTGPDSDQRLDNVQVPWARPSRERTPLT